MTNGHEGPSAAALPRYVSFTLATPAQCCERRQAFMCTATSEGRGCVLPVCSSAGWSFVSTGGGEDDTVGLTTIAIEYLIRYTCTFLVSLVDVHTYLFCLFMQIKAVWFVWQVGVDSVSAYCMQHLIPTDRQPFGAFLSRGVIANFTHSCQIKAVVCSWAVCVPGDRQLVVNELCMYGSIFESWLNILMQEEEWWTKLSSM